MDSNLKPKRLIQSEAEISDLLHDFYASVRKDDLIGSIFEDAIGDHWDEHIEKIERFWSTLMLGSDSYHGRPFPPHLKLNLKPEHFKRWLELFFETTDENFHGQKADEIKMKALQIGRNFLANIQYFEKQKK